MPLTALLAYIFGKGEGSISPWKYLYSFLVYLVCIPGIAAIVLNLYLVLIEKQSLLDLNLYTQILPIISMIVTLLLIRKNVSFDDIPGFHKISALIWILMALMALLWVCEKTHIFVISFMPFHYFIILLIVLLGLIHFGTKRFFS